MKGGVPATILLIACELAFVANMISFSWAMKKHFRKPTGKSPGVLAIYILGPISIGATLAAYHLGAPRPAAWMCLALLLYVAAGVLFVWSIRATGKRTLAFAFSAENPHVLIEVGPYRYVRHPFYTSYFLAWAAVLVAVDSVLSALPPLMMGCVYIVAATREEKALASHPLFGQSYTAYKRRTGRFLPFI